jgi:2-phosphoglycolate phosphatase
MLDEIRAVLFDFDGTLADSYAAITASVNHVRALHALPPLEEREVRRHVGRGPEHLLAATVPGADPAAGVLSYRAHHPSVMYQMTRLLPGAADPVRRLKESGRALGVCSNKPSFFTSRLLDHLGLLPHLGAVLGPGEVPLPKPAPDMLLAALARLGVGQAEALYVGDMVVDVETARAAGVRVWAVPTGSEELADLEAARPDRLLRDLRELAALA